MSAQKADAEAEAENATREAIRTIERMKEDSIMAQNALRAEANKVLRQKDEYTDQCRHATTNQ